jgi:hypothetical protein
MTVAEKGPGDTLDVVASAGVALGKGAWDCDKNCEIPPELEVCVALSTITLLITHKILFNSSSCLRPAQAHLAVAAVTPVDNGCLRGGSTSCCMHDNCQ